MQILLAASAVAAQPASGHPNRPLRLVVPFVPGGNSDFAVRIIAPKMSQELGPPIIIDNRAGAGVRPLTGKSPQEATAFLKEQTERRARAIKQVGVAGE